MRVRELIVLLSGRESWWDLEVVVRGYEDGVNSVSSAELIPIKAWDADAGTSYYGRHRVGDGGPAEGSAVEIRGQSDIGRSGVPDGALS